MKNEKLKNVQSVTPEDEAMFFTATTLVEKVEVEETVEAVDGHSEIFYG
jgi:hypothetical protein